jgi:hypothetical protein
MCDPNIQKQPMGCFLEELENNLTFMEKVSVFSHDYLKCCKFIQSPDVSCKDFTKKVYSTLIANSQLLEDFLDFHGAKNSKIWYYYRELSAAVRHLSLGGYSQKHICNRTHFYCLPKTEEFAKQGAATLDFFTRSLKRLAPLILEEARNLGIPIPEAEYAKDDFPVIATGQMLDCDIDDENLDQQKKNITKIASELVDIASKFDEFGIYGTLEPDEIMEKVPSTINEVEIRRFEMQVHNLQSHFDTYVIHGGFHSHGDRKLKEFRGHYSCVFHLLQIIGRLLHFYERHLHEAGYKNIYKQVQVKLSEVISPNTLLDRTINYGFFWVYYFLNTGKDLAKEIINQYAERTSIRAGIPVMRGFHLRPSLLVAKIVNHYGGPVELCVGEENRYDASSVLDIQYAGGQIAKDNITEVVFEGDARALRDIQILARVNYGENIMGKDIPLPKELSYLRS